MYQDSCSENELAWTVMELSSAAIIGIDAEGTIVLANARAESLFGYGAGGLTGQNAKCLLSETSNSAVVPSGARKSAHPAFQIFPVGAKLDLVQKDGSKIIVNIRLHPVETDSGTLVLVHAIKEKPSSEAPTSLLTPQKKIQSERLQAIMQMVDGLSHESRNALQRARGCLDLLDLDLVDNDNLQLTQRIRRALIDLEEKYESIKAYAAPIHLKRKKVDLLNLFRSSFDEWQIKHSHFLHRLAIKGSEKCIAEADAEHMKRVFTELISNSCSATSENASLTVTTSRSTDRLSPDITITIRDQSGGVAPELVDQLFEPFFTTKQRGSGLGMATVRRIVEEHGGTVDAMNDFPHGIAIQINLPQDAAVTQNVE